LDQFPQEIEEGERNKEAKMAILVFFLIPILFSILIGAFITFDKILKIQYSEFKSTWEADGRPYGFFWKPKDTQWLRSSLAKIRISYQWLFRTPHWAQDSKTTRKYFIRFCLLVLCWNVGLLIFFGLLLVVNTR
jgi:hypothetical protein